MPFESSVSFDPPATHATPLLAVAVPQGAFPPSLTDLDAATAGGLGRVYASGDFKGKRDETAMVYSSGPATRVLLVGTGMRDDAKLSAVRRAAAVAAKRARVSGVPTAAFAVAPEARGSLAAEAVARVAAEGFHFGAWHYNELKRPDEDRKPPLERMVLLVPPGETAARDGARIGDAVGAGQTFARGIQMLPGNTCTPCMLGDAARELAARHGFEATVLDQAAIEKEGLTALLAVAQGSAQEPRFIALEYRGSDDAPVVLVGKGVTFDTGGISIKPAPSMEEMKYDMSGAAAVLGTFEALGRLRPAVHVVGLVPSAENMPSGTAYKPGDVVRSHFGKTIEVVNTDAEGRLLLADALSYARRCRPACVIDAATLTGAMVIALGHTATGLMGTDEGLMRELREAGERADEPVWQLPLWDEYRDLIKSDIADVKNSGGRPAGSITAAWFLKEFVDGYPWAHLDIAGTAYSDREDPTRIKGPTGVCVRLFSEFVLARAR